MDSIETLRTSMGVALLAHLDINDYTLDEYSITATLNAQGWYWANDYKAWIQGRTGGEQPTIRVAPVSLDAIATELADHVSSKLREVPTSNKGNPIQMQRDMRINCIYTARDAIIHFASTLNTC